VTNTRRQTTTLNFVARKLSCILFLSLALCLAASAQTFSMLAGFNQTDGANPYGTLVQGTDGNFYGTTQFGGANGQGTVYKVTPAGALTAIYSFCNVSGCTDGGQPFAGLVLGPDGNFYGATLGTIFTITPSGSLTTLYTFCSLSKCADGTGEYAPLVLGSDGNFYGVTQGGGAVQTYECEGGCGTVFKITSSGTLTTLYSFHGHDGYSPMGGLVQGTDGNFYGTTTSGGAHKAGTVFKITPQGTLTLLHSFTVTDGAAPDGRLLQATDGNFYGTTEYGGAHGYGTAYKITPAGTHTLLRSFDLTNGSTPYAGLLQGRDGNFYGTTFAGGSGDTSGYCPLVGYCGTAFRLTPTGQLTTLYNFCPQSGCPAGGAPFGGLTQGSDGNLYGATNLGGSAGGGDGSVGTIYKITLGGK
jgi:uncharacterized repeat protein (TIGR03803 family)